MSDFKKIEQYARELINDTNLVVGSIHADNLNPDDLCIKLKDKDIKYKTFIIITLEEKND